MQSRCILLFLCTMIFLLPCCPMPFNKAVHCLLDFKNNSVMRTNKLNVPEETTSEGAKVSDTRNKTALL